MELTTNKEALRKHLKSHRSIIPHSCPPINYRRLIELANQHIFVLQDGHRMFASPIPPAAMIKYLRFVRRLANMSQPAHNQPNFHRKPFLWIIFSANYIMGHVVKSVICLILAHWTLLCLCVVSLFEWVYPNRGSPTEKQQDNALHNGRKTKWTCV